MRYCILPTTPALEYLKMANEKFQRRKKRNFCQQGKTDQKEQRSRLLSSIDYSGRRLENLFRSVKPNNA
ncbi:hypothetical protein T06_12277 [Trichinella sp. T6]|nr:hypothetical protein T06_12277 [Trichinella sp. T6]